MQETDDTPLPEPPLADPALFDEDYRELARPLYELVNQDPGAEQYPAKLDEEQARRYRHLLIHTLGQSILRMEPISCHREPGVLVGKSRGWDTYEFDVRRGLVNGDEIVAIARQLNEHSEDERTQDTDFGTVPPDLMDRATWFFTELQLRGVLPPLWPRYGQTLCRILAMRMTQPSQLIDDIFPFLVRNPPLGFVPGRANVYRVLVA